ncbi:hypothetical protein FVE85_1391 [Porphyridium purpureum]|uniref:Serine aminopeptidase S33 domain-containing protein n=1 Tax=Porphyridium purpureum TaxID=35688 RepID=A0A5J4YV54_PORPP|nr:hypothetical protein FVE85_8965 [Porphyridium purpureum]KAA8495236.1 hypothetical protein FVE85_1391 [Porphyridium purpureum]|eukprot:POR0118..scf226_27
MSAYYHDLCAQNSVWLLCIDREDRALEGEGESKLQLVARQMLEVLTMMKVDCHFGVVAQSCGTLYATALVELVASRKDLSCVFVGLISPFLPLDFRGGNMVLRAARRAPEFIAKPLVLRVGKLISDEKIAEVAPEAIAKSLIKEGGGELTQKDLDLLAACFAKNAVEMRTACHVDDILVCLEKQARKRDVSQLDLQVLDHSRTHIWHGTHDRMIPHRAVSRFHRQMSNQVGLTTVPRATHNLMMHKRVFADVLARLKIAHSEAKAEQGRKSTIDINGCSV